MVTFLLATRNRKKGFELRRLLKGIPIRFLTLDQFPGIPPVSEDRSTLRSNAVKKAVETSRHTILPVLADDSGLEVQFLDGLPGVRSARFAGPAQNDGANNAKLLKLMAGVPASKRRARFVCWLAVAIGGRLVQTFQGDCSGFIALKPAGQKGFGYDPIFIPQGCQQTMAQVSPRRKDLLSHRAKALAKLKSWLKTAL